MDSKGQESIFETAEVLPARSSGDPMEESKHITTAPTFPEGGLTAWMTVAGG